MGKDLDQADQSPSRDVEKVTPLLNAQRKKNDMLIARVRGVQARECPAAAEGPNAADFHARVTAEPSQSGTEREA